MGLESKLGLHDAQLLPTTCLPHDALGSGRPLVPVVAPSLYLQRLMGGLLSQQAQTEDKPQQPLHREASWGLICLCRLVREVWTAKLCLLPDAQP